MRPRGSKVVGITATGGASRAKIAADSELPGRRGAAVVTAPSSKSDYCTLRNAAVATGLGRKSKEGTAAADCNSVRF